jgi:hypothetical protein
VATHRLRDRLDAELTSRAAYEPIASAESIACQRLEANRPALTAIGQYVYEQGLAPRSVEPNELFLPIS